VHVSGGGVAFIVHPFIWSMSSFWGSSLSLAGATIVSRLSAIFIESYFSGCAASSRTISVLNLTFILQLSTIHARDYLNAPLQVMTVPEWQRLAPMYDFLAHLWTPM
jgi:hypothetical protein